MTDVNLHLESDWRIRSFSLNAVLQAVESCGVDSQQLIANLHLDVAALKHPEFRHPVATLLALYEQAKQLSGNEDLALLAGRIGYINRLNLQLYIMSVCKTFREYLQVMPSILAFEGDIGEVTVRLDGDDLFLQWQPLCAATGQQRYLSDQVLSLAVLIVRSLTVQEIPILGAQFTYAKPANIDQLQDLFGSKLAFAQPVSCLRLPKSCLDYPLTQLFTNWHQPLQASIEHLFSDQPADEFMANLRHTMMNLLPRGEMSIDMVAEALNVSRRTLQRRLTERGFVFRQLLQDLRAELARQYLADQRLSITDVSFLLGYSDHGSFTAAFKSWTGTSPSDYRQQDILV